MSKQISLNDLSPEQLADLKRQALEEEKEAQDAIKKERKAYKDLVNNTIPELFNDLQGVSAMMSTVKTKVFESLQTLVKMKAELYDRESDQFSHSFTTEDGLTIIIGHRILDQWDDTVTTGISKVHDFLETMATDDNSKKLVKTILQLLSKDAKGNLKASRVLQLKKLADDIGNASFIDAINIIQDAYRPGKSKEFITARYKLNGETVDLPLDISAVDFDYKMDGQLGAAKQA